MCPTSNVQTGAAPSIEAHPIRLLRQLSFRVTVNTDNRLMSGVSVSSEFAPLAEAFGYGWSDIEWLTINAMKSAFAHFDQRLRIINTVIKPGFATARAASDAVVRIAGRPGERGPVSRRQWRRQRHRRPPPADRCSLAAASWPPPTPRSARCCTGCPEWTRSARGGAGGHPGHQVDQAGRQAVGAGRRDPR